MKAERRRYDNGIKGSIAKFFQMKNSEKETFLIEICGGITMYLITVYILLYNQGLQGKSIDLALPMAMNLFYYRYMILIPPLLYVNELIGTKADATGAAGKFTQSEYAGIPYAAALTTGISTILMGVLGKMP